MALNIVDAYGNPTTVPFLATNPPPNPTPDYTPYFYETRTHPAGVIMPGGGINPNLIQALAGIGAEMDPEGAGGILGRAAINLSRQTSSQRVAEEDKKAYNEDRERLFDLMRAWGGVTPKHKAGLTQLNANPDGSFTLKGNTVDQPQNDPVNKAAPPRPSGEIRQENVPVPDKEQSNVVPVPEIGGTGRTITESGSRRMVMPGGPGAALSDGPSNTILGYAPDGTPIMAAANRARLAPLGPKVDMSGVPPVQIPDNPNSTTRQLRPGQRNVPKQQPTAPVETPQTMPTVQVTARRDFPGGDAPLGPSVSPIAPATPVPVIVGAPTLPGYQPPQTPAPAPVTRPSTPPAPLISGGGTSAPANVDPLLPLPRRRSQTMFDLRDLIPF